MVRLMKNFFLQVVRRRTSRGKGRRRVNSNARRFWETANMCRCPGSIWPASPVKRCVVVHLSVQGIPQTRLDFGSGSVVTT